MLSPSTPFWGLPCGVPRFWRLRVAKDFTKPEYYIGQTVILQATIVQKEVRAYVEVLGISWTGMGWEYLVELPENHPWFTPDDVEWVWVGSRELSLP